MTATRPARVAFLGPGGTYSHEAVLHHFAAAAVALHPTSTITAAVHALVADDTDYAVVPLANSTAGPVAETASVLAELHDQLDTVAQVTLAVAHCAVARRLSPPSHRSVAVVVSHEQALAQCRLAIQQHFPGVPTRPVPSTALAATLARDDTSCSTVAVCSEFAASPRGIDPHCLLDILHRDIQDAGVANQTTFIVLAKKS